MKRFLAARPARVLRTSGLSLLLLSGFFVAGCASVSLDPVRFASQAADANRDETRIEKALHTLCDQAGPEFCEKEARVLLENGKGELAKVAAARGCLAGRNSSCATEGDILLAQGKILEAVQVLTGACESKSALDGIACPGAGEAAFQSGDTRKALRLWKRGCSLGNLVSCYFEGKADRLENRVSNSLAPLKRACKGAVLGACTEYGISLTLTGKLEAAIENFNTDCDRRSHRACRWAPLLEEKLQRKDLDRTLDQDCRKNNSLEACYDSTVLQFLRRGGRTLAVYRWKENCKAGHKMSCWESFLEENGLKPLSQMNPELEKYCREGILVACYFRGLNYAETGHRDRALPLWSDACGKGEPWSCYLASESDSVGETERAGFRAKACEYGLKRACTPPEAMTEMVVKKAAPGPIDYSAACTSGDADACAYVAVKKAKDSPEGMDNSDAKEHFRRACLASSTLGCEGLVRALKK
jgi:hypothetical protein